MDSAIFRKVSLERLSSPERLDQARSVTAPREWLALLGIFFLLGAAIVWSFKGSLTSEVNAHGVIMPRGGVVNVVAPGSGLIVKLGVNAGDTVQANQVIGEITQPGLMEKIRVTDATLQDAQRELQSRGLITRQHIKQFDTQQSPAGNQPEESEIAIQARVADLVRNLATLRKDLATASNIISPYAGQVLEVKAGRGSAVSAGMPVASIQPDAGALEAVVYLNAMQAKDVRPGMEARITPGSVRREEYGFLIGKVTFVATYPATPAAMMSALGNESIMQSIAAAGPVTEVRIEPARAHTPSGFRWSSRRGPPLQVSSGTLCSAQIVTGHSKPITRMLPVMKDKFGLN